MFGQETVAKRDAVRSEISNVLKAFYCELCEKQFQTVGQYDEHTNSYAHHHKARFRDMQAAQKASFSSQEDIDKRREKERKREEKELRKIAKAAGIKMTKPTASLAQPAAPTSLNPAGDPKPTGFKKSGWATVGSSSSATVAPQATSAPTAASTSAGSSRLSWSTANTCNEPNQPSSSWSTVSGAPANPGASPPPAPSTSSATGPAPIFRTGGWTSLDTGSMSTVPAQPSEQSSAALPTAPVLLTPVTGSGWAPVSNTPSVTQADPPMLPTVRQEASRSGWQQFTAGNGSTRRR